MPSSPRPIVLPQGPGLVRKAQEIVGADVVVLTQKGKLGKGRCLAAIFHFTNLILFDTEKIGQVFLSFSLAVCQTNHWNTPNPPLTFPTNSVYTKYTLLVGC